MSGCPPSITQLHWPGGQAAVPSNPLFSLVLLRRLLPNWLLTSVALAGSLLLTGCSTQQAAPETSFVLLDGSQTSTQALRGKVVLVNFWATSCVTCVAEMPQLVQTHQKYQARGYETMAVAMSYDPPAYVVNFSQSRQLPFKVAIDNTGAVAKAWGDIKITPTTYLVNKRGQIVKQYVGEPDFAALHQLIEKLLAES
jgi:peroxiredoxin